MSDNNDPLQYTSNDIHDDLWWVSFGNDVDSSNLWEKPGAYPYLQNKLEKFILQQELETRLKNQYQKYNYLGINIIDEYLEEQIIEPTDDCYTRMLQYINDCIFPITYIDIIYDDELQLRKIGKLIYEILYVDFFNSTFKMLMSNLKVKVNLDVLSFDDLTIRNNLMQIYTGLLKQSSTLAQINSDIKMASIKYSQAIDLFDNNVDGLKDNFLIPIISKYPSIGTF
jgi:hypothetical protein